MDHDWYWVHRGGQRESWRCRRCGLVSGGHRPKDGCEVEVVAGTISLSDPPDTAKFREQVIVSTKGIIETGKAKMDIEEFKQLKRTMEVKILNATSQAVEEFKEKTGVSPNSIHVSMKDVPMVGLARAEYFCIDVTSLVEL